MKNASPQFQGKYRIASARCPQWDYTSNGAYLITICTKGRRHWFGEIQKQHICLSDIGSIVWKYWEIIPEHHPHIILDRFIVMPDHIHGIVRIEKPWGISTPPTPPHPPPDHTVVGSREVWES